MLTQLYDSRLRDTGMEAPQFALMMTLDKQGPCSQGALGRRYALDKTTVSRNLKWQLRSRMTAEQWDAMLQVFRTVTQAAQRIHGQ